MFRSARDTRSLRQPLKVTNTGEGPLQAVVAVTGAPTVPEPAAERGLQDRAALLHASMARLSDPSKAKQNQRFVVVLKVTEPQPALRPHHRRRLPAGGLRDRQSAAGLVGRHRQARLDPGRQGPDARGVPRRPVQRGVRALGLGQAGVHGGLCGAGGLARPLRACRRPMWRTCTVPTASAAPAPARSRSRRSRLR